MKAGDVCRCINDFTGMSSDELTVYKNDIVQIHSIVDRHWMEAEGGGAIGRVPSSILVQVDLPPHPPNLPLFVASAEFLPAQAGDLGLARGDFVIGLNPIDESWWCGELNGKKGIFPRNFVWQVNTDIMEVSDTQEKQVNMRARVMMSIRAQLPEELNLYAGDVIRITHVIDKDWFRGESNGETGILPASFVEIIEENSVPSSLTPYQEPQSAAKPNDSSTLTQYHSDDYSRPSPPVSKENIEANLDYNEPLSSSFLPPSAGESNQNQPTANLVDQVRDAPVKLSNTSSYWKTVSGEADDDDDIFDDDYFKQNMPSVYAPSKSERNTASSTLGQAQFMTPPLSEASVSPAFAELNVRQESKNVDLAATGSRYENLGLWDTGTFKDLSTPSALASAQELDELNRVNSISEKVESYFSQNLLEDSGGEKILSRNNNSLLKDYNSLTSPGYNEDNTGIEPYGRAVFSFSAQYPNELTFKKGDIIHLIKHIDSHWTLGRIGEASGIFPTSYVDIIVNCLHSEEEMFLSRSEGLPQTVYLGHAQAAYDFKPSESGDVSMSKGDILKILKFVNDNWVIVENTNGSKGMCPRNYLHMLVEGSQEQAVAPVSLSPGLVSEPAAERMSRLPTQDVEQARSRSSSPYSALGNRRSYKKDDFGTIKTKEVDQELAKNIASLDVTLRSNLSPLEKKSGESVFSERESIQNESINKIQVVRKAPARPLSVPNVSSRMNKKSSTDVNTATTETVDVRRMSMPPVVQPSSSPTTPHTPSTPTTVQMLLEDKVAPVAAPRTMILPPVPPRTRLSKSDSTKSVASEIIADSPETAVREDEHSTIAEEPVYSQVQKPRLSGKPSEKPRIQKVEKGTSLTRGDSTNSAAFPDDVSSVSVSENSYSSGLANDSTTPALTPQRPAPPPPPKVFEKEEELEEYYSLPPDDLHASREHKLLQAEGLDTAGVDVDGSASKISEGATAVAEEDAEKAAAALVRRSNHRRELVQEMVTTEYEYIHDLEALIQVISLAPSQKESQMVDIKTLMGNISQVVVVAKKFLSELDKVAYHKDEELMVGQVFLNCADEMCEVYKAYCSNHNVAAEPLLKKYIEEPGPAAFLQWVLQELQQHKIQLMDMRSVLIKPVQRVLKYPLFLDRLVSETAMGHPDFKDLMEAKTRMANVAKDINEYTKRLDLINKYRAGGDQSLQSKMQRVSMHSVVKKSARISAMVSEMLGIMSQTKDPEFDEEVAKFRCVQKAAQTLAQDVSVLLQGVIARHKAEMDISRNLAATLLQAAATPEMESIQRVTHETCNRLIKMFDSFIQQRVIQPAKQLVSLCEVPERLIQKRYHKMLDYDNAQYKLDKNKDATKTRILEEELSQMKGTYEALNTQLMMELPILTRCGSEVLSLATRSLVAARMYLQGHLAKLYLQLAQIPGLSYTGEEEMLAQFRVKYLQQMGEFRQLSFIPADTLQKTLPRAKQRSRKTSDVSANKKETPEATRKKVLSSYPANLIYVVTEVHTPAEVMELTLYPGDHVALLKNKDPLGRTDRWFIDDGDNKGFVRASSLRPLQGYDSRVPPSTSQPSTLPTSAQPSAPVISRPSTLPRAAPTPPLPERPPRYEDLFPGASATAMAPRGPSQAPPGMQFLPPTAQQAPPPHYPNQQPDGGASPLPSKGGCQEPSTRGPYYTQVVESEYYVPPLERQQSNEYNSPVAEENNIYEEIDQVSAQERGSKEPEESPIYEVIKDGQLVNEATYCNTDEDTLPEAEAEEFPFYYALYNFGGSDSTQLNLVAGQVVLVLHAKSSDWWFVEDRTGHQGYVPASYLTKYS